MLFSVFIVLEIIIAVNAWPCETPDSKVYSRANSSAVLQFSADLTNLNSPRSFDVKFSDGSIKARIEYKPGGSSSTEALPGVSITGDTAGNVVVTLDNVQKNNAGIYALINSGFFSRCNCLYILGIPLKPKVTKNNTPSVGESVTLTCSSISTTTPSNHSLSLIYGWRVDSTANPGGTRYSYSSKRNKLTVNSIVKEDANKQFTCSATEDVNNGYTSVSSDQCSFDVYYGPDFISFKPGNTSYMLDEGTTMSNIKCVADCFPSCTYRWTKGGQITAVSNTDTLSFGTIQQSYDGKYTCRATTGDTASKFSDKHVTIRVRYGPYQSSTQLFPTYEYYTINDGSLLPNINCSADCYPDCSYTWIKTKQGLNSTVSRSGILSLGTINPDDAATYVCLVTNSAKLVSPTTTRRLKIKVQYGPNAVIINKQSPYYISEGDKDVVIECSSDCYPGCSYEWTNVTSGSAIATNRKLNIQMVDRFMTSYYKCSSRNSARNFTKSSFVTINIIVQYAPDVRVKRSSSNVIEGQDLTLSCIGLGIPSDNSYTALTQMWGNVQILNSHREATGSRKFSSIRLSSLKLEDSGKYTCTLNNGIESLDGKLSQSGSTYLFVEGLPKVLTEELRFTGTTGETAKIQVSIYSYPSLDSLRIIRHDGKVISSNDYNKTDYEVKTTFYDKPVSLNGSVIYLMIRRFTENDFGNYTLELQNRIGITHAQAFIVAKEELSKAKDGPKIGAIAAGVCAAVVVIASVAAVVIFCKWRQGKTTDEGREDLAIANPSLQSQYEDLKGIMETEISQTYESLRIENNESRANMSAPLKFDKTGNIYENLKVKE